jgi:hypothetical protein
MNTEFQCESFTIIKMSGAFDSIKGKLKFLKTQPIKRVITQFMCS